MDLGLIMLILYISSALNEVGSIHLNTDVLSFRFVKLIGSPDDASLGFLRSNNARRYVRQLPQYPKQQFSDRFPNNAPGALDLLEKMLVFDPSRRITGIITYSSNNYGLFVYSYCWSKNSKMFFP